MLSGIVLYKISSHSSLLSPTNKVQHLLRTMVFILQVFPSQELTLHFGTNDVNNGAQFIACYLRRVLLRCGDVGFDIPCRFRPRPVNVMTKCARHKWNVFNYLRDKCNTLASIELGISSFQRFLLWIVQTRLV